MKNKIKEILKNKYSSDINGLIEFGADENHELVVEAKKLLKNVDWIVDEFFNESDHSRWYNNGEFSEHYIDQLWSSYQNVFNTMESKNRTI